MDIPGLHRSGRRIPLEISFAESRNGSGVFFVGFLRDLSERHWGHSRLAAQYAVAELLSTADDEQIALREILACIGEHLGFSTGNLWLVEQDRLVWSAAWHAQETATASFTEASRQRTFTAGEGLPGRVWAQEVPAWIAAIAEDENFPRADAALASGLRSGLGFRVRRGAHVVGVIEYFSNSVRPLEPTLVQILNAVGHQISQFLERKHAQDSLRATEAQYRMLFENSNDAFGVSVDERFVYVNQAYAAMFRYDVPKTLEVS